MPQEAVIVACAAGRLQLAGARLSQEVPGMRKGDGSEGESERSGQGLVLIISYPILLNSKQSFVCVEIHWRKHYNHIVFTLVYINKSYQLIHLHFNPMDPVDRSISMKYLPWKLTHTLCLSIFGSAQGLEERHHMILLSSGR